jgi:hypothetical protein
MILNEYFKFFWMAVLHADYHIYMLEREAAKIQ